MLAARSVQSRFKRTGVVGTEAARELGLVGLAARASGVALDARRDLPGDLYSAHPVNVLIEDSGDCWARLRLRMREIDESLRWLRQALDAPAHRSGPRPRRARLGPLRPDALCVSVREGFRGPVVQALETGPDGRLAALQGAGSVAAQLVRPRAGGARQRDLGLSDLQQELRPLVLRQRPVGAPMLKAIKVRASQGTQYIQDPRRADPAGFRGKPVIAERPCDTGCGACVAACPTTGDRPRPRAHRPGPLRDVRRLRAAPARPASCRSATTSGSPPPSAAAWSSARPGRRSTR